MTMVPMTMPNGSTMLVEREALLWLREALPEEAPGMKLTALRFKEGSHPIYSNESVNLLRQRFSQKNESVLGAFTLPGRPGTIWVNVLKVTQIMAPVAMDPGAKSVLMFSIFGYQAVRESIEQARFILNHPEAA